MNKWVRQIHRWLSIIFTVALLTMIATAGEGEPPTWLVLGTVLPLGSLLLTGLYLFVLPYGTKWRRRRSSHASAASR